MKYSLLMGMILLPFSISALAQGQVIKCVDNQGSITYHNDNSSTKGLKCSGTNLATIDQLRSPPRKLGTSSSTIVKNNSSSASSGEVKVSQEDQKFRDLKRREILVSEMEQENKQLSLVKDMLDKANKKDEVQMKQLNNMLQTHQANINTLEKELKIAPTDFSNIVSSAIPGLGIPKNKNNDTRPEFQIEGASIIKPPTEAPKQGVASKNDNSWLNKKTSTNDISNTIKEDKKKAPVAPIPDLNSMRNELEALKRGREGEIEDKSQHIEIKRRSAGVNISQANLNYQPLPTPLSVPDLGIGK